MHPGFDKARAYAILESSRAPVDTLSQHAWKNAASLVITGNPGGRATSPRMASKTENATNGRLLHDQAAPPIKRKESSMNKLIPKPQMQLVDPQAQMIVEVLQSIGLPYDNIIASAEDRAIIGQSLPALIESLPPEAKQGARYLSKFVVGAGFGLFDYSLNAIWNEVILDLHKKVVAYGLDIFMTQLLAGKIESFIKRKKIFAL